MWLNGFRGIMAGSGASCASSSSSSCVGAWWVPVCARSCCRIQSAEGARTAKVYIRYRLLGKGFKFSVLCISPHPWFSSMVPLVARSDPISRPVVFDGSSDSKKVHEHIFFRPNEC
jgi:hypothetical protein